MRKEPLESAKKQYKPLQSPGKESTAYIVMLFLPLLSLLAIAANVYFAYLAV